jgi:hypothetical protein
MKTFKEFLNERASVSKKTKDLEIYKHINEDDVALIAKEFDIEEEDIKIEERRDIADKDSYVLGIKDEYYWYILDEDASEIAKEEHKHLVEDAYEGFADYITKSLSSPDIFFVNLGKQYAKNDIKQTIEYEFQSDYEDNEDLQEEYSSWGEYMESSGIDVNDYDFVQQVYDYYEEMGIENPLIDIVSRYTTFDDFYEQLISGNYSTKWGYHLTKQSMIDSISVYNTIIELHEGSLYKIDF